MLKMYDKDHAMIYINAASSLTYMMGTTNLYY